MAASSMNSEQIQSSRSKALHCRRLAATASDPEVAQELLRVADEIEAALLALCDRERVPGAGPAAVASRQDV